MNIFRQYSGIIISLIIAILPLFLNNYWIDVGVSIGLYALLALSLNIVLGQSGIFHMGHTAFYAVGAYITAIINTQYQIPIFWLLPLSGIVAALCAFIIAYPIIELRGDYFLIATIGIVEIIRIILINDVGDCTGGSNGIFGIERPIFFGFRINTTAEFYYLIWGIVGIASILFYFLFNSRFGRAINYIKEDDIAAEGFGVNIVQYKIVVFSLGAFWAGVAGNLFATKMTIISPNAFSIWESIIIFVIVIFSGGSQVGVLIGTLIIVALPEVFRDFSDARMLIFGLIMMLMMVFRPQGLFPPQPRIYKLHGAPLKKHT